jgi:hypothetical protein
LRTCSKPSPAISSEPIPVSAIGGLVGLTKIHPGLAEIAVTLVLDREEVYDADPWSWRDIATDALSVVAGGLHDETVEPPVVCLCRATLPALPVCAE